MSNKSKKAIDRKPIEDLAQILNDLNLSSISYTDGDFSISVSKGTTEYEYKYRHLTKQKALKINQSQI